MRKLTAVALSTTLLTGLSGCGDDNNTSASPPAPGVVAVEDRFSTAFGAIFRTAADTDPAKDPVDSDVVALDLNSEPIDF